MPRPVRNFACPCSRERSKAALLLLGRDELTDMRDKDGGAELTRHFCNDRYDVSAAELQELIDGLPTAALMLRPGTGLQPTAAELQAEPGSAEG